MTYGKLQEFTGSISDGARGLLQELRDAGYVPTSVEVNEERREPVEFRDESGRECILRPYARHRWLVRRFLLPEEQEERRREWERRFARTDDEPPRTRESVRVEIKRNLEAASCFLIRTFNLTGEHPFQYSAEVREAVKEHIMGLMALADQPVTVPQQRPSTRDPMFRAFLDSVSQSRSA